MLVYIKFLSSYKIIGFQENFAVVNNYIHI